MDELRQVLAESCEATRALALFCEGHRSEPLAQVLGAFARTQEALNECLGRLVGAHEVYQGLDNEEAQETLMRLQSLEDNVRPPPPNRGFGPR